MTDKILLVMVGGSLTGFMALIAVSAISSGFVAQGAGAGFLAALFGGCILAMLAD